MAILSKINGFKLYSKIYLFKNKPCRVFIPSIQINSLEKFYWIRYAGTNEVGCARKTQLTTNLTLQVLYG